MNDIVNYFSNGLNDYLISNHLTNVFIVGKVGSTEDFFIVGTEPPNEAPYPMITGNFLDSEGKFLFRLVRNVLVINPNNCNKIQANLSGYEIHDSAGKLILKVFTEFNEQKGFITTIESKGYNNKGELVFDANKDSMEIKTNHVLGFDNINGNFGVTSGFDKNELDFIRYVFRSGGKIHEPIVGRIENKTILLDGKAILGAQLIKCDLFIQAGDFIAIGDCHFDTCGFHFQGNAGNIYNFISHAQKNNVKFIGLQPPPNKN